MVGANAFRNDIKRLISSLPAKRSNLDNGTSPVTYFNINILHIPLEVNRNLQTWILLDTFCSPVYIRFISWGSAWKYKLNTLKKKEAFYVVGYRKVGFNATWNSMNWEFALSAFCDFFPPLWFLRRRNNIPQRSFQPITSIDLNTGEKGLQTKSSSQAFL